MRPCARNPPPVHDSDDPGPLISEDLGQGATGCSVPDTERCRSAVGAEMPLRHEYATSRKAWWLQDVKPTWFWGVDNSAQGSIGAAELDWLVKGHLVTFVVYVVPGVAVFLMSKPDLKALGEAIDLEMGSTYQTRLDLTVPLSETVAGHYEIAFLTWERKTRRQIHASEARAQSAAEAKATQPVFQQGRVGAHRPSEW